MKSARSGTGSVVGTATLLAALLTMTGAAAAQAAPTTSGVQSAPVEIAVTYDALHTNHLTAQEFWAQGGAIELEARLYRGLDAAARVEGLHAAAHSTNNEPLSMVTAVFGPRYTIETSSHRYAVFAEVLAGEANGFHSLFSVGSGPVGSANVGTTSSANALAVDLGGGFDVRLGQHVAIRVVRASYLRTQFPNSTTNVQNSLSLGTGFVLRFGK